MRRFWWVGLMLLALGCDDGTASVDPDALVRGDGPVPNDQGAQQDGTLQPDARVADGSRPDRGSPPDGSTPDAAVPEDAALDLALADVEAPDGALPDADVESPDAGDRAFRPIYPIDADFTEGGIYDPVEHAFYVGCLACGGVYRIDAQSGEQATVFEPDEPGVWWTLGMAVDVVDHILYVCAMDDRRELDEEHDYAGYLWGFDLADGERTVALALNDAADGGTCTDVAVADDGTVYVNDRENPRLYAYAAGELSMIVEDDELSGGIVGQNALVVLPDQTALLSLVYLPSRLVRISLPGLVVSEVDIDGDFFDGLPALSGADGMTWSDDSLLVMFTSQLNRLRPVLADWSRAESTTVDVPGGMTDVVNTPGGDYLLNGQAVDFAFGRDPDPAQLVRFEGDL